MKLEGKVRSAQNLSKNSQQERQCDDEKQHIDVPVFRMA
jgi:hypothetical protein